jgi:hypothetical protein
LKLSEDLLKFIQGIGLPTDVVRTIEAEIANDKAVTLHETGYSYKAIVEKLLNFGTDAIHKYLLPSLLILDTPASD